MWLKKDKCIKSVIKSNKCIIKSNTNCFMVFFEFGLGLKMLIFITKKLNLCSSNLHLDQIHKAYKENVGRSS